MKWYEILVPLIWFGVGILNIVVSGKEVIGFIFFLGGTLILYCYFIMDEIRDGYRNCVLSAISSVNKLIANLEQNKKGREKKI